MTDRQKLGTLLSCSVSCFIAYLDSSIVNTALPAIQAGLSTSVLELQWVMNIFVLCASVLLVIMGRLADLWGRRLFNVLGVGIFGLFSLLAGFATTPGWLIFCRFMQGVTTAAIIPSSLGLISHAFPGSEKGKAIAIWSAITGFGLALGPVAGGLLVSAFSWRWIFYINVPFALLSLILNFCFVKESRDETAEKKVDLKGVALLIIGIGSLVSGVIYAPEWGWMSFFTVLAFAVALTALVWFYLSERKSRYPTIPFGIFANTTFLFCSLGVFCMIFFFWAAFFLMPLYLQNIRHEEPYIVGLMLLPVTASMVIFSSLVGHLMRIVSGKILLAMSLFFFFLCGLAQTFFHAQSSVWFILVSFFSMGIAWVLGRNVATTDAIASAPQQYSGTASGVLWTIQNIGGAVGLALAGTIFRRLYEPKLTTASFLHGYHAAMWLLTLLSLASFLLVVLFMKKPSHHKG